MQLAELEVILGVPLTEPLLEIESFLAQGLTSGTASIDGASRRMLSAGGKRLRPMLVLAVASGAGSKGVDDDILRCCAAVEYMHVGSLVHDDSIDEAPTRRCIPTVNAVEGWKHSILVGDYILGRAGQMAALVGREVAIAVADAIVEMSLGQTLEEDTLFDASRTEESALASISGKTASLVSTACQLGARCAGLGESDVAALASFGHRFGMAFQLIDDVLDWVSTDLLMGKPVQNDVVAGVYTLPLLYAREDGADIGFVTDPATVDVAARAAALVHRGGLARTIALAERYAVEAAAHLAPLYPRHPGLAGLGELPLWYNRWALTNLVPPERHTLVQLVS